VSAATNLRVVIESDRACYILGESWRGAAQGCRNAVFLAVGTGIGAGILVDGRVLRGEHGIAGAIGWLALSRPFRREYIDSGCFEHHASGAGLAKAAQARLRHAPHPSTIPSLRHSNSRLLHYSKTPSLHSLSARDVFAACERGDAVAKKILAEAVQFWGMAVANLVSLLNPETIILGGGVFGPATQFLSKIHAEARRWAQPISFKRVRLQVSKLGADAGLYGAAWLALQASRTVDY
jgi:glucokinase